MSRSLNHEGKPLAVDLDGRRSQEVRKRMWPSLPQITLAHRFSWSSMIIVIFMTALWFCETIEARSPHPPPVRRIHSIPKSEIHILPRQSTSLSRISKRSPNPSTLLHSDTFLLTIPLPSTITQSKSQSDSQPISILLRPTEHLFHPNAKITYHDGRSEPLIPSDWRVYTGDVIRHKWVDRVWASEMQGLGGEGMIDDRAILGSARIMVHHPGDHTSAPVYEGMFSINGENHNILTKERYARVRTGEDVEIVDLDLDLVGSDLVIYRDRDVYHLPHEIQASTLSCNHDSLPFNSNTSHPVWQSSSFSSSSSSAQPFGFSAVYQPESGIDHHLETRDDTGGMTTSSNFINSINSTAGCPSTQQIVYMGVALDCNYVTTYGSEDQARIQTLNNWNQISALYKKTFNISLGIIELVVQNSTCPTNAVQGTEWNVGCSKNLTLDQRLSLFSQWRGNRGDDGAGLWHLMSACPTASEVGVAWLGTLCQNTASQQSGSVVSGTAISTATKTEWSLISHEIGHGFGAIHDCTTGCSLSGTCCPLSTTSCDASGRFIMNPTTASTEVTFSGCTLGNICSNIASKAISGSCIQTPGLQTVISLSQCGNGILEAGEQCDPGLNATSACCDPSTCKFRSGAVCDPSNSACCTSSCQLAGAGVICRPAVNPTCDVAETCTGSNATCPADVTVADGTSCGSGLSCAAGTCTSLDLQCQTAGASNNLTTACGQKDDTSCVVTCKSPNNSNQCIVLQTPLVDGSPCGYGGHCYNSTCAAGSTSAVISSWYSQNLQIAIPVTVLAGLAVLIILFLISRCIWKCCARARPNPKPRAGALVAPSQRESRYITSSTQPRPPLPPPPLMSQRNADSLTSIDPITRTSLISRESSPNSLNGVGGNGYGNNPVGSGNGQNGYGPYLTPQNPGGGFGYGNGNANGNGNGNGHGNGYGNRNVSSSRRAWEGQNQRYVQQGGGAGGGLYPNAVARGGGQDWVDDSRYNGPNYGVQEATGYHR